MREWLGRARWEATGFGLEDEGLEHGVSGRSEGQRDRLRAARRERGRGSPERVVHRGSRSGFAGHRRARHGARGGVRPRDLGRGSREDPHRRRRRGLHRKPQVNARLRELREVDPEIHAAIDREAARQEDNLELIPSENAVSRAVLEAQGSVLTNKYAEGYPGRRYYGGCEHVDVVEQLAIDRARELFGAEYANVQPHSGSQANMAVYFSQLEPGDTI